MAEMMGPFDPASPCLTTFCKRISKEDFEKQASDYTQDALAELLQYLEYNPTAYHNILRKRKREDAESGGIFSYLKAKMLTTMFGDEYLERLDQKEAKQKMAKLKDDIRSSYDYAEEAKGSGKRFSRRIANRCQLQKESNDNVAKNLEFELGSSNQPKSLPKNTATTISGQNQTIFLPEPPPPPQVLPPPPPPPPPPPLCAHVPGHGGSKDANQEDKLLQLQTKMKKSDGPVTRSHVNKSRVGSGQSESAADQLLASLKDPNTRAALRPIGNSELTPCERRQKAANVDKENEFSLFNHQLITKFQNARSPKSPIDSQYLSDVSTPDSFATSP